MCLQSTDAARGDAAAAIFLISPVQAGPYKFTKVSNGRHDGRSDNVVAASHKGSGDRILLPLGWQASFCLLPQRLHAMERRRSTIEDGVAQSLARAHGP